jgi:uncharacterized coiled-coil protein SlyX
LTGVLLEAIKELRVENRDITNALQNKIADQKQQITGLQHQNAALVNRVTALERIRQENNAADTSLPRLNTRLTGKRMREK